jgi:UDP-N-acetylglucosamine--N-acetylmuramyl-(pentapeptide) pyrophosphoryl-undecaprenol N-acetylglucosamine transferase
MERTLVPPVGIRYFLVPMAPPTSVRGVVLLAAATLRSLFVLLRVRPRVTVATGGYASTPAALASWLLRIPVVLFLPDVFPGKAVAWLAPLARQIAVSSEVTQAHFPPGKAVVTGYPVREPFVEPSRVDGRLHLNLPDDATVLCVFGGSQGARHINQALARHLPELLSRYYVIHICGEQRLPEAEAAAATLAPEARERYLLFPYLQDEEMAGALAAADLAVCRAGASVLGELPATATPAILVPLPQLTVHQRENAEYLADHGAAVVLDDERVDHELGPTLERLLADRTRLAAMAAAASALARPHASEAIVDLVDAVSM